MSYATRWMTMAMLAVTLGGCATSSNPNDPFEGFNRAMFSFNDGLDQAVLKPAATVYQNVLPNFVQTGIGNFFGNIGDVWTAVNNLLQGKGEAGMSDVMRVAINTVFGVVGVVDIGTEAGLPKHREDFGETLAVWGVGSGPYLVLPFLGSSTLRDTAALPVDFAGDLWHYTTPVRVRNTGSVVRVIDNRAAILNASNLIEDAALDRYEFIRDAYLQRRANKINDGYNRDSEPGDKARNDKSSATELQEGPARHATVQVAEPTTGSAVQLSNSAADGAPVDKGKAKDVPLSQFRRDVMMVQRAPSSELPM